MNLTEYQTKAMQHALMQTKEDKIKYGLFNTAGEVGEVQSIFAKSIRDNEEIDKDNLIKEIGDVLWSLTCLCDGLDIDLETVATKNLEKLKDRQSRGVISGSGDNR